MKKDKIAKMDNIKRAVHLGYLVFLRQVGE
jgi:hypothetical protein